MSSNELDALIIEHIVDLDRTGKRIADIEHRLFSAMNGRAEHWAKRHGWKGEFSLPANGGWRDWSLWLAPTEWRTPGDNLEEEFDCRFKICLGAGDSEEGKAGEAWNYVTRLCGLEGGQIGFCFERLDNPGKRKNQNMVNIFRHQISSTKFIVDSDAVFFLRFQIEPSALASALREDDPDAALEPFEAALDALLEAQPVFDGLVEHLRGESLVLQTRERL